MFIISLAGLNSFEDLSKFTLESFNEDIKFLVAKYEGIHLVYIIYRNWTLFLCGGPLLWWDKDADHGGET